MATAPAGIVRGGGIEGGGIEGGGIDGGGIDGGGIDGGTPMAPGGGVGVNAPSRAAHSLLCVGANDAVPPVNGAATGGTSSRSKRLTTGAAGAFAVAVSVPAAPGAKEPSVEARASLRPSNEKATSLGGESSTHERTFTAPLAPPSDAEDTVGGGASGALLANVLARTSCAVDGISPLVRSPRLARSTLAMRSAELKARTSLPD